MNILNIQAILDDKWFGKKVLHNEHFVQWAMVSNMGIITQRHFLNEMTGGFKALYLWFDPEIDDRVLQRIFNHYRKECQSGKLAKQTMCGEGLEPGNIYRIYNKKLLVLC